MTVFPMELLILRMQDVCSESGVGGEKPVEELQMAAEKNGEFH